MDYISDLPKFILHDILSKLPTKDATRTSILSKSWRYTWSSFPILVFDEFRYLWKSRSEFVDYVDKTLLRFHGENTAVKQFKLIIARGDDVCTHIDFWMQLLVKSGIQVLDLDFHCYDIYYRLPRCILEAKSLTKLVLSRRFMFDQTLLSPQVFLTSLQVLSLEDVQFENEKVFYNFISNCPCIEYLTLYGCYKLEPTNHWGRTYLDFPIVENCINLRHLSLACGKTTVITGQWFLELFDRFPLLESLKLGLSSSSKKITVTSRQLKVLKLSDCTCMEVIIDAPKLYLCDFRCNYLSMPAITFVNNSSQLEVQVHLQISHPEDIVKLRESLQSFKPKNLLATLSLAIYQTNLHFDINALPKISVPPPRIKTIELEVSFTSETFCLSVMAALLWVCRPTNISVKLGSEPHNNTFVKVLCKKLVRRDDCCCSPKTIRCRIGLCKSSRMKFWWHGLNDVKIRSSSLEGGNYIHSKTLLNALSTLPTGEEISFRLHW